MGFDGPLDRKHHARQCRGMEDTVDSFERMLERVTNADVGLDNLGGAIHVLTPARREIIEETHAHPISNQSVDKMRTDKPGAAGHRYHARRPRTSQTSITHRQTICAGIFANGVTLQNEIPNPPPPILKPDCPNPDCPKPDCPKPGGPKGGPIIICCCRCVCVS